MSISNFKKGHLSAPFTIIFYTAEILEWALMLLGVGCVYLLPPLLCQYPTYILSKFCKLSESNNNKIFTIRTRVLSNHYILFVLIASM